MVLRLLEVLLPLFLQVLVDDALERGLVDFHAAALVLERLQQQFLHHLLFHGCLRSLSAS
jgi:hypothetical protein